MNYPSIIFENGVFAVINKPAGIIVNNSDTSKKVFTLQDFVAEKFSIKGDESSEFVRRGGVVHRLDKETSGVIVVALIEEAFFDLQSQFKNRLVRKEYTALCHGKMIEKGEIRVPVGRLPWNRTRFGVIPKGRDAYTTFSVIEYKKFNKGSNKEVLSLIRAYPHTGRTHQLRVHFQYVGHPIFSDALYAGRKISIEDRKYLKRHFLHAGEIEFNDPTNSTKRLTFKADLSQDLVDFLNELT